MINEPILGNKKNIIGTDKADLVLETLGKVYIKQGKSLKNLTDLFKLIDKKSNKVLNKEESTIIVNSINNLQYPGDGKFIFSSSDRILYITFENQLIPLIDARNYGTDDHILKKGDDMLGTLNFKVPFTIQSASLINNLNSNFLNGYRDTDFAKKSVNEIISGNWTFTGNNQSTNKFTFKDVVINNTIGTSAFQGGYTGYGWQLDTKTNTLTIDNLIVRKLLSVYELVVNQIRATNGTLWVTNSATVDSTPNLYVEDSETVNYLNRLYNSSYYMYDNVIIYTQQSFSNSNLNKYIEEEQFTGNKLQFIINYYQTYNLNVNIYDYNSELNRIKASKMFVYIDEALTEVNLYNKYFSNGEYFIARFKDYPLFQSGDIVRCQKFERNRVRYYDALIITLLQDNTYLIQLSPQFNDLYTDIESGTNKPNSIAYSKTEEDIDNPETILGFINIGDDIVQIGNLYDTSRQGSVYITSTDDNGPYLEVLDGVNRPDFSVLYETPTFYTYSYLNINCYISKEQSSLSLGSDTFYIKDNELYKVNEEETIEDSFIGYYYAAPSTSCLVKSKQLTSPLKTRLGHLKGVYDTKFDVSGYGLYSQNVFLTGDFYLNNGKSVVEFTQEQILLQFGNAGITIKDDSIFMDAKKINIQLGDTNMQLFSTENGVIKINTEMLDIEGYLSANGIYVYPEGVEPDPTNPELGASSYMSSDGRFYSNFGILANGCYLGGSIERITIGNLKSEITIAQTTINNNNYSEIACLGYRYYNNGNLNSVVNVDITPIEDFQNWEQRYIYSLSLIPQLSSLEDSEEIVIYKNGFITRNNYLGTSNVINSYVNIFNSCITLNNQSLGYNITLGQEPGVLYNESIGLEITLEDTTKTNSNIALKINNQEFTSNNYSIVANCSSFGRSFVTNGCQFLVADSIEEQIECDKYDTFIINSLGDLNPNVGQVVLPTINRIKNCLSNLGDNTYIAGSLLKWTFINYTGRSFTIVRESGTVGSMYGCLLDNMRSIDVYAYLKNENELVYFCNDFNTI